MAPNTEQVLQLINKKFISLSEGEVRESNKILALVLDEITAAMKYVSPLFKSMFETYHYGGSTYDGLKIGKPDEFNIDLKLCLPKILDVQILQSDQDGFVHLYLKDWDRFTANRNIYAYYKGLENLITDEKYVSQEKLNRWLQGIVAKSLNIIRYNDTIDCIELDYRMSGPAVTIKVTYNGNEMEIDLVAVFRIEGHKWPQAPVRSNINKIFTDYLVVPKPPKNVTSEIYWRLSFPEQERKMINGLNSCKPALKLLKKLRDTRTHNIPSYFIKTIFLWEIEKKSFAFWSRPLTNVFIDMLIIYKEYLENGNIPYFWNEDNNLLQHVKKININNITGFLQSMIRQIEANIARDPYLIALFLLPTNEYYEIKSCFGYSPSPERPLALGGERPRSFGDSSNHNLALQQANNSGNSWAAAAAIGVGIAAIGLFAYHRMNQNKD